MSSHDYQPPSSSTIARRQNDERALQLLVAQRRFYNRAKRWQSLRWIGILVIGLGGPFFSLLAPAVAVSVAAVTGVWLFAGRTVLALLENRTMLKAACVQEELDQYLFDMPDTIDRSGRPTPEDIALIAADKKPIRDVAKKEKLVDWYTVDANSPGTTTIAIAQRSNAAYTDRLIRTTVTVWAAAAILWLAGLITWASISGVTLATFLLGALFPVLPAFLDVSEYVMNTWKAARDRADLAATIGRRFSRRDQSIEPQDLLVWQERLFDLRRTTPQVPNWLYKITRARNERAMKQTASHLRHQSTD